MPNKKNFGLWLVLIVGLLLRLISINQSLWLDEATTANVVKNYSFKEIVSVFAIGDFHPPFYYLLIKIWRIIFGYGEIALRMPSVIFSLALIALSHVITNIISNKRAAFFASLLIATSPLGIYYSQEARMYMMAAFFVTSAVYFYIKALNLDSKRYWILLSLSILFIGISDYLSLLILPVFFICLLFISKKRKLFIKMTLSLLPLLIAFFIWLPVFLMQLNAGLSVESSNIYWWSVLGKFDFKQIALIFIKFITGRISFQNNLLLIPFLLLYLIPTLLSLFKGKIKDSRLLVLLWFFVPVFLGTMLSLIIPVFSYFRFIFILPAFYILIAFSTELFGERKKTFYILILIFFNLLFSSFYLFNKANQRENWREMVSYVEKESEGKNCNVLFVANSQMEAYKYYSSGKIDPVSPDNYDFGGDCIWLMRYVQEFFDPEDLVKKRVEENGFRLYEHYDFNGVVVARYDR